MPPELEQRDFVGLNRPTIFAHRGASAHAPENTLAAFELAVQLGTDAIELDVKLSADGHVVVIHDETVDRTTDGTGRVKTLTLSALAALDAGSKFSREFKSQKIPTLDDVFAALGDKVIINVELTNYSSPTDDLAERVVTLVKRHHIERNILLSSFNFMALIRARGLLPRIPVGYLTYRGQAEAAIRSKLIRFGPQVALHPAYDDVTEQLLQMAHQARTKVNAYTVDQPEVMRQLFTAGVDGIFTNDPALALNVIAD
jgi:glycerophosphoryl diester phosphodiesterase